MSFLLRFSIAFIIGVATVVTLWIWYSDFHYNFTGTSEVLLAVATFLSISWAIKSYSTISLAKRIATFVVWLCLVSLFTTVVAPLSYLFASVGGAFMDSYFVAADRALGFNWVAMLTFLSDHPWVGEYSGTIYLSSGKVLLAIWTYLALTGRFERGELLLASVFLSCFVIIAVAAPFAAKGPFGYFNISPELYRDLAPVITVEAKNWFTHLTALRDGTFRELGRGVYEGIVEFPSFHTALSVLMILALRGCGAVFWISGFYNLVILLTVPIDGGHYFIDMIAGGVIALIAWYGLAALDLMVAEKRLLASLRLPEWKGSGELAKSGQLLALRLLEWSVLKPARVFRSNS
ncbi:MAG: phosphatase PAP2 family protein [Hyphomicrobiaceae bacterium]|nr:phosphatase PAP2 family protein [Hyphomicrobiaceae bacterium]